ncbi:MAG: hypothetical protein HDR92_05680 [Bacteroides sp.]|nr:hypothetical protein [Bacteroides sp.]
MINEYCWRGIGALLMALMSGGLFALSANEDAIRNRVGFSGTLTSSYTYSLDVTYHYMLSDYIGVCGALGWWKNYYEEGRAHGNHWTVDDDDLRPSNVYLRPSMVLKPPGLTYKAARWALFAEPGVMLNIPYKRVCVALTPHWPHTDYAYVSTSRGQWFAAEVRAGVNVDIELCSISFGYILSNLDIYSQYRHLSYDGISFRDFYPVKPCMQGAFLSVAFNF